MKTASATTSGSMVQVLVVRVQRFIMTEERNMAVENLIVRWVVTVTVSWKYGTMYLHSLMVTDTVDMKNLKIRT